MAENPEKEVPMETSETPPEVIVGDVPQEKVETSHTQEEVAAAPEPSDPPRVVPEKVEPKPLLVMPSETPKATSDRVATPPPGPEGGPKPPTAVNQELSQAVKAEAPQPKTVLPPKPIPPPKVVPPPGPKATLENVPRMPLVPSSNQAQLAASKAALDNLLKASTAKVGPAGLAPLVKPSISSGAALISKVLSQSPATKPTTQGKPPTASIVKVEPVTKATPSALLKVEPKSGLSLTPKVALELIPKAAASSTVAPKPLVPKVKIEVASKPVLPLSPKVGSESQPRAVSTPKPKPLVTTKVLTKPSLSQEDDASKSSVPEVMEVDDGDDDDDDDGSDDDDDDDGSDDDEDGSDDDEDGSGDDDEDGSDDDDDEDGSDEDDPLAINEDDSILGGSATENSLMEAPDSMDGPPKKIAKIVQPIIPSLLNKRSLIGSASPATPGDKTSRRRGRPTRAEMEQKEKERQEKLARGEVDEPKPKRRGRKPREDKPKKEKRKTKQQIKDEKKRDRLLARQRLKEEKDRKRKEREDKKKKRLADKLRPETEEEKEAKLQARKARYEEIKRAKMEKDEKRKLHNEKLKVMRLKKKEEEAKQRQAYEKRMQELKASFLDDGSHLSGADLETTGILDETSQSSLTSAFPGGRRYGQCGAIEMSHLKPVLNVTAETLMEYRWPLEGRNSEHFFLQEQVSEYLGIKSFKRRYPDLQRRNVDHEEKDFLVEIGVVNEVQADLGLTAIPSHQILDIMSNDFYEKYDEYMSVVAERKDRTLRQSSQNYHHNVSMPVEKHKLQDFVEKAVRSAANWNKLMNAERKEKRKAYFDLQTFNIHKPMNGKGEMKVIPKPKIGHYPVALIPGQYTDYYHTYSPKELSFLPLNTALKAPPILKAGMWGFACMDIDKDKDDNAEHCSLCSSDGSVDSDSEANSEETPNTVPVVAENKSEIKTEAQNPETQIAQVEIKTEQVGEDEIKKEDQPVKPKRAIDEEISGAKCKNCNGDRQHNKLGQPEILLHCSACDSSCHPTCLGLCLELLEYVTNYNWECTECKVCSKCKDHADEDKMLFCDLCDRGYHSYCVGLDEIPSGRWHCVECSYCMSCQTQDPSGGVPVVEGKKAASWVFEYKVGNSGNKIYSHTLCSACHKAWKKGQFCPECSVCFGREQIRKKMDKKKTWKSPVGSLKYANCWVCGRQHHAHCIAHPDQFICAACQKRTLEKSIGSGNFAVLNIASLTGTGPGDKVALMNAASASVPSTPYSSRSRR